MSGKNQVSFYEMFPFLADGDRLAAGLSGALVVSAVVSKEKAAMNLELSLTEPVPPIEIRLVENAIAGEYGLESVRITTAFAKNQTRSKKESKKSKDTIPQTGSVIMGKRAVGAVTRMDMITLELGKVTVKGEVCDVSSRKIEKRNAWALSFDLTDYTGTIHVSKFMTDENAAKITRSISKGMHLTVSGNLGVSRYDGDLTLEPVNIVTVEREVRNDTAQEKRVELHLHTKMSALDAVTDTVEVIQRAAEWGHQAIAITDHGVVHSFPDAMYAANDKIKVIYGVEGYYINDVQAAVTGDLGALDSETVIFDIETTGLSPSEDAIIEIGAVMIGNGMELARFSTYADPGMPIPQVITELTGIRDTDVKGAPHQKEAVEAFLEFVKGRPLAAHNANFDVGFIYETCQKYGIPYTPKYIDTLAVARAVLPDLKNHKLDTVAAHFGYSDFGHHRALNDAEATAHIHKKFLTILHKDDITHFGQIDDHLSEMRKNRLKDPIARKGRARHRHIILLAKNQTGLTNLYKLVSKSHLDDYDRHPVIKKSVLSQYREGLIIGSACESGEIFAAVAEKRSALEQRSLAEFYDYLEIQPICNNTFMLYGERPRAKSEEELRGFNRRIVELGKELDKPVVATGDTHFLDPEHEIFRHILLSSKGFDNADDSLPIYFKTTNEMLDEFSYLGEETAYEVVVRNSRMIADACENVRPLPPEKTLYVPKIERSAEDLKALVFGRLKELYGENPPKIVNRRVETELGDILERNYDVIYMSAQKLVADSMKHGYLVGSRGSVGSSIVAYLSGITEVNSLPSHYRCPNCRHSDFEQGKDWGCGADMPDARCSVCGEHYIKDGFNIPFETFLGFGGDKVPDIDLNFSGEYQARAHKYTTELFGADHVFRAGTIGTVAEKTAYGYVKNYLETVGKKVTRAEENRLAQGCVGVKRTTGQHPGGLVVIPQDMEITDFCPAQHPADSSDAGIVTTHFEYKWMEDNLLKLDELGHDDPTMIKMLEDMTDVDARKICLGDPDTMAIFKSPVPLGLPEDDEVIGPTGSIGIPEFGTGFTRQMLCDTQPEDFDTLVRLSGFSHGTDVWLGNAKDLILSGKATVKETIGCRDDIMLYLISKGLDDRYAFKISENVRKGKGLPDGAEAEMERAGVPGWYVESCKKIKYLFPKAHAVAYVMMAFRIAWFKVNRPLAFYSAYFYRRSQKDSFDADCMTRGIDVVRVKIREIKNNPDAKTKDEDLLTTLEACYEFYMRGFDFLSVDIYESDPVKFLIVGESKLRPPFVAISGLGETAARDIAENRTGREFISVEDISAVCAKVSKTHLEQLKTLGALRGLPETSQMSLF